MGRQGEGLGKVMNMDALMAVGTVLNGGVVIGNDKNFGDDGVCSFPM